VAICLPLICFFVLSGCNRETPIEVGPAAPQIVVLAIPDRFLADVPPRPLARGSSIADVAAYIAEFEGIVATANDQLLAARRVQACHRRLISGEVATCNDITGTQP